MLIYNYEAIYYMVICIQCLILCTEDISEHCRACSNMGTRQNFWVSLHNYHDCCVYFLKTQIGCDKCQSWYHLRCVNRKINANFTTEDLENLNLQGHGAQMTDIEMI